MSAVESRARFDDGKEAGALRTIGELSKALGIKQHVLRYWEQQFPMLKPLKRSGGRRYYRPDDIALVETIDRLVNEEGFTLKGAKAAIQKRKKADSQSDGLMFQNDKGSESEGSPSGKSADLVPKLRAIRSRLADALDE